MEDTHQSVKKKLHKLVSILNERSGGDLGTVSEGKNSTFIIKYSGYDQGKKNTLKLLKKIKEGGLLNDVHLPNMDSIGSGAFPEDIDLNKIKGKYLSVESDDSSTKITLTTHSEYKKIIDDLSVSIKSAEKYVKEIASLNRSWAKEAKGPANILDIPPNAKVVSEYLASKVEEVFPKSNVKVAYSKGNEVTAHTFTVIFDNKVGKDYTDFDKLVVGLNNSLRQPKDNGLPVDVSKIPVNRENTQIGFQVSGKPELLLALIKKYDHDKLPKPEGQRIS